MERIAENSCGIAKWLSKEIVLTGASRLNLSTEQCRFRTGPQPLKCAPVHPLWPCRKRLKQVDTAAQSHPDLPRLAQTAMQRRLLLAFIGQAVAASAGK
jgi:hypothetical protein